MGENEIKTNMLLIAMMGLAMFAVGIALYLAADKLSRHGHLLLPLPPISVAAYIYMLEVFATSDAPALKGASLVASIKGVLIQSLVGGASFVVITCLMLGALIVWNSVTSGSG